MATNCTATNMVPSSGTWIVDPTAGKGDFTTITAAVAAASAGDTIYVRPGTYTENFSPSVNLSIVGCGIGAGPVTPVVTILGKITNSSTAKINIYNLFLQTNADFLVSNTSTGTITLNNCYINIANSSAIQNSSTGVINIYYCHAGGNGGAFFSNSSTGTVNIYNCFVSNAVVATYSDSAGTVNINNSYVRAPLSTSTGGTLNIYNCGIQDAGAVVSIAFNGTGGGTLRNSWIRGNGATSTMSIAAGVVVNVSNCSITGAAMTGAGTLQYGGLDFTSTKTISVTTQTPVAYDVPQGGTGSSSFNARGPLVAASTITGALTSVTPSATSGVPFISQGSSANPAFGTMVVGGGGTGNASQAAYSLVSGGTTDTGAFQAINPVATGQMLTSTGTTSLPAFSDTPTVTQITKAATTVAGLPTASSNTYAKRFVTDALGPVFGSTVVGGGAVKIPVWSNGTNWIVG